MPHVARAIRKQPILAEIVRSSVLETRPKIALF
jgi:hypothetical protein